jgi:hypothetical protein
MRFDEKTSRIQKTKPSATGAANFIIMPLIKKYFPGLAENMSQDDADPYPDSKQTRTSSFSEDIVWEDRGSDITVIAFTGLAIRYGGLPQFEFKKILAQEGDRYNHIFVRDVRRSVYFRSSQGGNNGLQYYQERIQEAISHLPPSFNVAIGISSGGQAPFLFCNRLPIHQILAFNPCFPTDLYADESLLRLALRPKMLFSDHMSYIESILVVLSVRAVVKRLRRFLGRENIPDEIRCFLGARPQPPAATIFYSRHNPPDFRQAMRLKGIPGFTLKPVNSARHICLKELRDSGKLGPLLHQEIHDAHVAWLNAGHRP